MKVIKAQAWSVLIELVLLGSTTARGLPVDLPLLSLVPAGTQILAGIGPSEKPQRLARFFLFTVANTIDYEDFISLAGADPSLQIDELIFTASAGSSPANAEHSVIVSGRLQHVRIYRTSGNSSGALDYRGVVVLPVRPFDRERAYFQQDRLLAVLSPTLAIFGTKATVQEEIDRFLDRSAPDPKIAQSLGLLNSRYDSWYLVRSPMRRAEFARILNGLSPALSEFGNAEQLLFGIRYRKRVEFEFATIAAPSPERRLDLNGSSKEMFRDENGHAITTVQVVKIDRDRFDKWLVQATGR